MDIKPKIAFINATRDLINRPQERNEIHTGGLKIQTDPEVFNPELFFSSRWFAEEIARLTKDDKIFIEVGCGSGIISIKAALSNTNLLVYSTDINEKAAELTKLNADRNGVVDRVRVLVGDVLDTLPQNVGADSIFWSMPFGYLPSDQILQGRDVQVFDPGYRAIRKFFATAKQQLSKHGKIFIGFSQDIGHYELLEQIADDAGFTLTQISATSGVEKESVSMEIYEIVKKRN